MGVENITIVRKAFTGRDELGKATYEETEIIVPRCLVAPTVHEHKINGVTEVVYDSLYSLFFPAGTVIKDDDVFIVRGSRYWKDGNPRLWDMGGSAFNPAGVEVSVRTINGADK